MKKGDFVWLGVLCAVSAVYIVPGSRTAVMGFTAQHPYIMGFVKFGILASMGELVAVRIGSGAWKKTIGFGWKAVVWGVIGMVVTLMFEMFSSGVRGAIGKGLLWAGPSGFDRFGTAFLISSTMNLVFAPVFMTAHRFTDTYIETKIRAGKGAKGPGLRDLVAVIDWQGLLGFVVVKTIPFFWIPAHTIVFLLPSEFRILASAYLSIALGVILSVARLRKAS